MSLKENLIGGFICWIICNGATCWLVGWDQYWNVGPSIFGPASFAVVMSIGIAIIIALLLGMLAIARWAGSRFDS